MASYPDRGTTPWDDALKAYLDEREVEVTNAVTVDAVAAAEDAAEAAAAAALVTTRNRGYVLTTMLGA